MADPAHRAAVCPAHRLHAARPRQEPLPGSQRPRKHRVLRPPVRAIPRRTGVADRRVARQHRARAVCRPPGKKLSGGMRQKLGLCCSLIHDPDLLILDEPTTGVDPLSRRQFWELIERIRSRRQGMSVVVATGVYGRGRAVRLARRNERRQEFWRPDRRRNSSRRPGRGPSRMPLLRCCRSSSAPATRRCTYRRAESLIPSRLSRRAASPAGSAISPQSTTSASRSNAARSSALSGRMAAARRRR